jgi:hypothetical protein
MAPEILYFFIMAYVAWKIIGFFTGYYAELESIGGVREFPFAFTAGMREAARMKCLAMIAAAFTDMDGKQRLVQVSKVAKGFPGITVTRAISRRGGCPDGRRDDLPK